MSERPARLMDCYTDLAVTGANHDETVFKTAVTICEPWCPVPQVKDLASAEFVGNLLDASYCRRRPQQIVSAARQRNR